MFDLLENVEAGAEPRGWLAAMLDEIDFGMLLVVAGDVVHVNHRARVELANGHPLRVADRALHARRPEDAPRLRQALAAACDKGQRRMITLGHGGVDVTVAIVPLAMRDGDPHRPVLLLLGKQRVCDRLSTYCFANLHGLTGAETQVLEALCAGVRPADIARLQGVAISTVRTQIGSIRLKTGADNIADIVRRIALLPPLVGALRAAA